MIKVLLFDLGNVVLTNDHAYHTPEQAKQFCAYFNVTLDNLETAFSVSFPDYSLGRITEDEFWGKYLYTARADKMDIPYAKDFWRQNQAEVETMLCLLKDLKSSYRLAALSTIPKEWLVFKRRQFKLDDYFEVIISSGDHGVRKPDPRIYEVALKQLDTDPRDILFIDDYETVLLPAQELGMQTILFRGQEDLVKQLRVKDPEVSLPPQTRK